VMKRIILSILVFASFILHLSAEEGTTQKRVLKGKDLVGVGNTLFRAESKGIKVIDVSVDAKPKEMVVLIKDSEVYNLALFKDKLFAACGKGGLVEIDISKQTSYRVSNVYEGGRSVLAVAVVDEYILLGCEKGVLIVLRLDEEKKLKEIGQWKDENLSIFRVCISENTVFLSCGSAGLVMLDITNKNKPLEVSRYSLAEMEVYDSISKSGKIYIACNYGLGVLAVENSKLVYRASYKDDYSGTKRIYLNKDVVYLFGEDALLNALQVSGDWKIEMKQVLRYSCKSIYVNDSKMYLNTREGIVTLNNSDFPVSIIKGRYLGAKVRDNKAFLTGYMGDFEIFDIRKPESPLLISRTNCIDRAHDVFLVGNNAFIANSSLGLKIFDISDAKSIVLVSSILSKADPSSSIFESAFKVIVVNDKAYVAQGGLGLSVINISNPAKPYETFRGNWGGKYVVDVFVNLNRVYLACYNGGVIIVDIGNMKVLGEHNKNSWCKKIIVSGKYAFVSEEEFGVKVLDVSNPSQIKEVSNYKSYGYNNMFLENDILYFGPDIIDVKNPENPVKIGGFNVEGEITSVCADGNYVYYTTGLPSPGLWIYKNKIKF